MNSRPITVAAAATTTWGTLLADASYQLGSSVDARRITEEASGHGWADLQIHLDDAPKPAARQAHRSMVARRARGEPLQYVLGRWGFRELDLVVDSRALIPRPETETVVDVALRQLATTAAGARPVVADLGTGSGAIACAVASEVAGAEVWATDFSPEALALAEVNRRRLPGDAGGRLHLAHASWWDALPARLRHGIDLVVSNPPYVAAGDLLADEVSCWEPAAALFAGVDGMAAIAAIINGAQSWLRSPGALVVEVAAQRAEEAAAIARNAGFTEVRVHPDLAGRPRVLVGRV